MKLGSVAAMTQQANDRRAALLMALVCGLMLSQVIMLGAIAVLRAHEGAWVRSVIATVPVLVAFGAAAKALARSSGDGDSTLYLAGVGALAWSAGAALQAAMLFVIQPSLPVLARLVHGL
ncbi:MAG: hypothetical protein VB138_09885 [Burkholderia sp.]